MLFYFEAFAFFGVKPSETGQCLCLCATWGFEPLKSCCGVQILISACTHHQLFF